MSPYLQKICPLRWANTMVFHDPSLTILENGLSILSLSHKLASYTAQQFWWNIRKNYHSCFLIWIKQYPKGWQAIFDVYILGIGFDGAYYRFEIRRSIKRSRTSSACELSGALDLNKFSLVKIQCSQYPHWQKIGRLKVLDIGKWLNLDIKFRT